LAEFDRRTEELLCPATAVQSAGVDAAVACSIVDTTGCGFSSGGASDLISSNLNGSNTGACGNDVATDRGELNASGSPESR
jgi:hypothetical protein